MLFFPGNLQMFFSDNSACKAASLECGRENNDHASQCLTEYKGHLKKLFSFSLKLNTHILAGGVNIRLILLSSD